ncbi:hypothetical protein D9M72_508690 [compost metagenome]
MDGARFHKFGPHLVVDGERGLGLQQTQGRLGQEHHPAGAEEEEVLGTVIQALAHRGVQLFGYGNGALLDGDEAILIKVKHFVFSLVGCQTSSGT